MNTMTAMNSAQRWYREPWPWFLMAGPALVVIAGVITFVLAANTENALVVDNYYKEGLGINRVLDANRNAAALGYRARLQSAAGDGVRVTLSGAGVLPSRLWLYLIHPTHGRMDRTLVLDAARQGEYLPAAGAVQAVAALSGSPRWYVRVQDEAGNWRLSGEWDLRQAAWVELSAGAH